MPWRQVDLPLELSALKTLSPGRKSSVAPHLGPEVATSSFSRLRSTGCVLTFCQEFADVSLRYPIGKRAQESLFRSKNAVTGVECFSVVVSPSRQGEA